MNEMNKAEFAQALQAYLIPSSMFVACLIMSAGMYITYTGNHAGVVFIGVGFSVIIWALFTFVRFQNKHRARGESISNEDLYLEDFDAAKEETADEDECVLAGK
jgi:hypothetical protein